MMPHAFERASSPFEATWNRAHTRHLPEVYVREPVVRRVAWARLVVVVIVASLVGWWVS
jgi:hypothetical protein